MTEVRAGAGSRRASATAGGDRRLKVLFIPAWYPSPERPLAGNFVREHARAAAILDDVTVLSVRAGGGDGNGPFSWREELDHGVRTIRVAVPRVRGIHSPAVIASCERLLGRGYRPDVIHAHVYLAGVAAALLAKLHRIPLVVTEHWTGFPMREMSRWRLLRARVAFASARRILPVSSSLQRAIEGYGIKGRFTIVANTVDTELFRPKAQAPRREIKEMICVSILDQPRKGIDLLLAALAQVREGRSDFHLHIVGDGPRRAHYERLADELGLQEFLTFHGRADADSLVGLLHAASFYVLPSLFENFSVATAEALATGTPVLATRCGGPEDFVTPDVGITVPPGDVEALAQGIAWMLANFDRYDPVALAAYARGRFSHEAVGAQLHDVYREAISLR